MAVRRQHAPSGGSSYVNRLFQIESGGNPGAVTGSNRGLGQFGPAEERTYGINDANRRDPNAQAAAVMAERAANEPALTRALGRAPTDAEHYLAHQQGLAGASVLLSNPDVPAWQAIRRYYGSDAIAQKAITGNIPSDSPLKRLNVDDISSAGFTAMWRDKFNRGLSPSSGTEARADQAADTASRFPYIKQMAMAGNFMSIGQLSSQPSKNIESRPRPELGLGATEEAGEEWRRQMIRRQQQIQANVADLDAIRERAKKRNQ